MTSPILITGSRGQLGDAIRRRMDRFPAYTFTLTDIDELDLCDKKAVLDFVRRGRYAYIINCAAYTAVDRAESDAERCMRINRDAVGHLATAAREVSARLIHISTDYVFDGRATRPYREDDPTSPTSVYGRTKLAGEQLLLEALPTDAVILRTAWLYSEVGNNFVKTMLRLGAERPEIRVVNDQLGSPTYAGDLAEAVLRVLTAPTFHPGIYHYTDDGVCSWYDFARHILRTAHPTCIVRPIPTADYPTPAARPAYSVLDKTRIRQTYGVSIPRWQDSLDRCLQHLLSNNQ
ncbi:dTDP-4-dehydrorhamnose reductase [Tannerella sp. oral taxon 808]|nr:dTDP-4-dehydrorhamnose reductase [Tannerella sp. oral taxon 808]